MSETVVAKASPTLTVSVTGSDAAGSTITPSSISSTLAASSGTNDQNVVTFTVFGPQTAAPDVLSKSGATEGTVTPCWERDLPPHRVIRAVAGRYLLVVRLFAL